MTFVGAVLGAWAGIYLAATFVTQQTADCGGGHSNDRLVALVPAALSFMGAVMVGFWNRPERRARRRRRRNSHDRRG